MRPVLWMVVCLSGWTPAVADDDEPPVCPVEGTGGCPPADLSLVADIEDHCFGTFIASDCEIGGLPAWAYCLFGGLQLAEYCEDSCKAAELLRIDTCEAMLAFDEADPSCD